MNENEFAHDLISEFINSEQTFYVKRVFRPLVGLEGAYCQICVMTSFDDEIHVSIISKGRVRRLVKCNDVLEALAAVQKLHDMFRNGEIS